jgi:hypothetical protein
MNRKLEPLYIPTRGLGGRYRCVDGTIYRHDPQRDDPYLETAMGTCVVCGGNGCEDEEEKQ